MTCLFLVSLFVIISDRIAKFLVLGHLTQGRSIEVVPKIFHLTLVLNKGAAFGLFRDFSAFFTVASMIVVVLIGIYVWHSKCRDIIILVALGLILGGATGNLIDRIFFGYVIDFLDFRVWPVFNIADSSITIGAALLASKLIFGKKCSTI